YLTLNAGATGLTNLTLNTDSGFGDPYAGNGFLVVKAAPARTMRSSKRPDKPRGPALFTMC
ncbi:hypothetical protein CTI14_32010, partial [Methylobacterium radiotolerans]